MKKAVRDHLSDFAALIVLLVIALAVGGYILGQQRLRFPLIEDKPTKIDAEFSTAQAITPGQGQTVRVSGVQIGSIGKVTLREGRAVVTMDIEKEYDGVIREDAKLLLRPKTGLKDMFIEVTPGDGPPAKAGYTLPIQNTLPDVNLDEFLSVLDGDTRDYLQLLIGSAADGLRGRGDSLRQLFKRFEPTHRDIARVTGKVSERRRNLRRLVFNLNRLNARLAEKDDDLAQLVDSAATTFRAFARQDTDITEAVGRLPGALSETTQTLAKVERFSNMVGPSLERLRPAVRRIDDANAALRPLAEEGTPILRERVRPFVRSGRIFVRDLRPAARGLAEATPDLTRSFVVLNRFFNLLGYNEEGREGAGDPGRDEGYLFWTAWLGHVGNALFSTADANGAFRPTAIQATCQTLRSTIDEEPEAAFLQGLTGAVLDPRICPENGGVGDLLDLLDPALPGGGTVPPLPSLPSLPRKGEPAGEPAQEGAR